MMDILAPADGLVHDLVALDVLLERKIGSERVQRVALVVVDGHAWTPSSQQPRKRERETERETERESEKDRFEASETEAHDKKERSQILRDSHTYLRHRPPNQPR
jgi:hypothetical protein